MLPDIQPGNTKILYFFNCLLDGMHTNIPYICDFSRGGLNTRLSARIQTLLRGHRYRGYSLWGFWLFKSGKLVERFEEENRRDRSNSET